MQIKQGKPCHRSNYSPHSARKISYIVIHYTAGNGDSAKGNCNYSSGANRGASAHYFVGDDGIYQSVQDKDRAWHCGSETGKYKHPVCRNANSIGIEMCSKKTAGGVYYISRNIVEQAAELTRYLMEKYNIPKENVVRHYDVTGKRCPEPFVRDSKQWEDFKERLEGDSMTSEEKARFNELASAVSKLQKDDMIYNYIDDNMPDWAREGVRFCLEKGIIEGDGDGLGLDKKDLKYCTIIMRLYKLLMLGVTK